MADFTAATTSQEENPFHDLVIGSKNFWAGYTGREDPPPPSYRIVDGKQKLGRYMDPWGCEAHMRGAKDRWRKWYTGFWIFAGFVVVSSTLDWVFWLFEAPIFAVVYVIAKSRHRQQYDLYYHIQQRMIETDQPEWVPYDKDRLKLLEKTPLAVWP